MCLGPRTRASHQPLPNQGPTREYSRRRSQLHSRRDSFLGSAVPRLYPFTRSGGNLGFKHQGGYTVVQVHVLFLVACDRLCLFLSSLCRCRQWLRGVMGFRHTAAEALVPGTGTRGADSGSVERLLPAVQRGDEAGEAFLAENCQPLAGTQDCRTGDSGPDVFPPMADVFRTLHPNRFVGCPCAARLALRQQCPAAEWGAVCSQESRIRFWNRNRIR